MFPLKGGLLFDCLPKVLQDKHLNILPESRSSYVMGDFLLYQEIPELKEHVSKMAHVDLPEYESIDIHHVHSEANAIHVMTLTGILDDFLQVERNVATFSGRMGTGNFDFYVDTFYGGKQNIHVSKAQCEIDGGFENDDSVVIIEAKNVVHRDFHIRQLYYPYRLWKEKVKKPIRLVFSVYSNMIYRLFEYRFDEIEDYSSISLVKSKNYSLQDTTITQEDLLNVRRDTEITENDDKDKRKVSFPQANVMEKVISLMENLYHNPMTKQQIAELMNFDERQSDYYYNAGCYLELFQKAENNDRELTRLGERVFKMNYKERQLHIVSLILKHKIFADFFDSIINTGSLPNKKEIEERMIALNICNNCDTLSRRANSVLGWLKWIFNLTNI